MDTDTDATSWTTWTVLEVLSVPTVFYPDRKISLPSCAQAVADVYGIVNAPVLV